MIKLYVKPKKKRVFDIKKCVIVFDKQSNSCYWKEDNNIKFEDVKYEDNIVVLNFFEQTYIFAPIIDNEFYFEGYFQKIEK